MAGFMNNQGNAEDGFEDCDEMWDQRSDFPKLGQSGYRNAILGNFDEAEKEGRVAGFSKACQRRNPTFILAKLDGCLTACLVYLKDAISEEQRKEACALQAEIKDIMGSASNPNWEILEDIREERQPQFCENSGITDTQCSAVLVRTKAFCDRVGWKIPEYLIQEDSVTG